MKKEAINTDLYRKHKNFHRNQQIYSFRYIKGWSLREIAMHFHLPLNEIKEALTYHKHFFKQEYGG